jgi:putative modified peptide
MTDTALTKEQGLALLTKLAKDDAFRARFEAKPAHALFELGVPAELIVCLPAPCLCSRKLASKDEMEEARKQLAANLNMEFLVFFIPGPKINS